MSNMHLTLAILGIGIIAAVFLYNTWSIRRHLSRLAADEANEADGDTPAPARVPAHASDADLAASHPSDATMPHEAVLDALIFSLCSIQLDAPVSGKAALAAHPRTQRVGSKYFRIEGFNTQTRVWEIPQPQAQYGEFQAGIQLADRQGALHEIEFSRYVILTQGFADAIGGAAYFPDMVHEVARARELDQFAAQHDATLSFMVLARHATWTPGYIRQTAARYGFDNTTTPGRMEIQPSTAGSPPVLVLEYDPNAALADELDQVPIRNFILTLDVNSVSREENPFGRLRAVIDGMARDMEGILTDPDGRAVPPMALEQMEADITRIQDALDARGLSAGSMSARVLFR